MKVWKLAALILIALTMVAGTAHAAPGKVFMNLTSDDTQRATMAINFAMQLKQAGNDVTLFLNLDGVKVASSNVRQMKHWQTGKTPRQLLADAMAQNITIIICPMCMQWQGIPKRSILPNILVSAPDITIPALMDPATKTLSY